MNVRKRIPGLAERLKEVRANSGLSQQSAGELAEVHPVSIAKFESGNTVPTLGVLYKLAAAYGVNICDLLPGGVSPAEVPTEDATADRPTGKRK